MRIDAVVACSLAQVQDLTLFLPVLFPGILTSSRASFPDALVHHCQASASSRLVQAHTDHVFPARRGTPNTFVSHETRSSNTSVSSTSKETKQ